MEPVSVGRVGVDLIKNLIPPDEGDSRVYRWRVFIAIYVGVSTLGNMVHIAWACGWLAFAGINGFVLKDAYAQDYKKSDQRRDDIDRKVEYIQRAITGSLIKDTLKTRCIALNQNNQAALDAANTDLVHYEDQYYVTFGRPYIEPPCSVVLIARGP